MVSGSEAGIYAIARIECNPRIISLDTEEEDRFNKDLSQEKDLLRVELTILRNLINNPITKDKLLEINGMENPVGNQATTRNKLSSNK